MNKTIQISIKQVYGRNVAYPICISGKIFTSLTGKKTLSPSDIRSIQNLGFQIEFVQPTFEGVSTYE